MILYPHNREAYEKVAEAFRHGNRAAVVHATGTGKSFIIEAVAADYGRVAVIAPNNYVLAEVRKRAIRADFLTYPTVMAMKDFPEDRYDLIVLDEFHRAGAECWGQGIESLLQANPDAKVLGTTATEIRYLDGARNMADELFWGNVVSRLPLTEAWLRGILPVPKYVVGLYNYEDVYREFMRRLETNRRLSEQDRTEAKEVLRQGRLRWESSHGVADILRKHLPAGIRRMIVFCDRTDNLPEVQYRFTQWMNRAGFRSTNYTVHYRNPDSVADMEDFERDHGGETGVKVLFAINMLNEGVHVSGVDAVVMLRSTASKLILLQQIGRCMNVGSGTQPVILDLVDNLSSTQELERIRSEYASAAEAEAVNDPGRQVTEFTVIDYVKDIRDLILSVNAFRPLYRYEENVENLRHFVEDLKAWPRYNCDDRTERGTAAFAYNHREDPEVRELREKAERELGIGPWRIQRPFEATLQQLSDFIRRELRWPDRGAKDPEEKDLFEFAYRHLQQKYSGKLDEFRDMIVAEYGCDISFGEGHAPVDRALLAEELLAFVERERRWPSFSSKDKAEAQLYSRAQRLSNDPEIVRVRETASALYGVTFRRARASFEENAALLGAFVKENGRWPGASDENSEERFLRNFLYAHREDPAIAAIAEEAGLKVEFKSVRKTDFETELAHLKDFVEKRHKWPSGGKYGKNPDIEERDLHRFAARHKDDLRVSALLKHAQQTYGFTYNLRYDTEEMFGKVEAFMKEKRRWPSSSSKDKEEATLGSFLSRAKKKDPERFAAFAREHGHLSERIRKVSDFDEKLAMLRAFVEMNRAWPRQDRGDSGERSLARFVARNADHPDIVALKKLAENEYGDKGRKKRETRLKELKSFFDSNGRLPDIKSADTDEKSLAMWCKAHYHDEDVTLIRSQAEAAAAQDEEKAFRQKLAELDAWIKEKGRWPSHHSKDREEYEWGYFVNKNRTRPEVVELKKSFRKESDVLVTAPYEVRLKELRDFVRTNRRLPVWNAEDPFEKGLYYFYVSKKNRPRYREDIENAVNQLET